MTLGAQEGHRHVATSWAAGARPPDPRTKNSWWADLAAPGPRSFQRHHPLAAGASARRSEGPSVTTTWTDRELTVVLVGEARDACDEWLAHISSISAGR